MILLFATLGILWWVIESQKKKLPVVPVGVDEVKLSPDDPAIQATRFDQIGGTPYGDVGVPFSSFQRGVLNMHVNSGVQ